MRRLLTRFSNEEYFKYSLILVDKQNTIAEKKGVTSAQLSIAFVEALGDKVIPHPGSS